MPGLHRRAAGWFTRHGQVVDAIRHTQAAGDWSEAARLLADHSFSLTLDGQAQTIQALVRAFPQGAADDPELALVRATSDVYQGRLDEAAAHLAVAESQVEAAPADRRRRLRVAVVSLKLSLARRRGHLGVPRGPTRATAANPAGLTARQVEVLGLLGEGLTDAEIAARLSLSTRTVGHHVSALLAKLGVSSRRQAAAAGRRLGVVPAKDRESGGQR